MKKTSAATLALSLMLILGRDEFCGEPSRQSSQLTAVESYDAMCNTGVEDQDVTLRAERLALRTPSV